MGLYSDQAPFVPRIGGTASSYVPMPQGSAPGLRRHQVAPGLGIAGEALSDSPWLGLAQALNAYLSGRAGVGGGTMFGAGFGRGPSPGAIPSRRTIYGPGPRAF